MKLSLFLCATYTFMMLCGQNFLSLFVLIFLSFIRFSFVTKSLDSNILVNSVIYLEFLSSNNLSESDIATSNPKYNSF